jgi:hypothetical protein
MKSNKGITLIEFDGRGNRRNPRSDCLYTNYIEGASGRRSNNLRTIKSITRNVRAEQGVIQPIYCN